MLAALSVQTTEEEARRRGELEQLLLRTGQGDRDAFARLYGLTRDGVYCSTTPTRPRTSLRTPL